MTGLISYFWWGKKEFLLGIGYVEYNEGNKFS